MKDTKSTTAIFGGVVAVTALAAVILFDQFSANRNGEIVTTVPAARHVVAAPTIATDPGIAIRELGVQTSGAVVLWAWVAPKNGFRLNVSLNSNAYLPEEVWRLPSWRSTFCPGGRIPVKVWALRSGTVGWQRQYTTRTANGSHIVLDVSMPCERLGYVQISTAPFQLGPHDQFGIEYSPAIMAADGALPFGSQIDSISNDPISVPAIPIRADVQREVTR